MSKTVQFQTIQFSISTLFKQQNSFFTNNSVLSTVFCLHTVNIKTVLFQTIQFSKSTLFTYT